MVCNFETIIHGDRRRQGAFFHHFRSKGDLAHRLMERFAANGFAMFDEWDRRAEARSDDPCQELIIFIKLFEEWLDSLDEPFAGCLFAVYVHESTLFDADVNELVKKSFKHWQNYYQRKFDAVIAVRLEVTAIELSELIVSILEGAFILSRASRERDMITRQCRLFRSYLKLLFED